MKFQSLLRVALMGGFMCAALTAGAATGETAPTDFSSAAKSRCQADPLKCEEIKKRMAAHREACQQDPEACKKRHEAARQRMQEHCAADPAQCKAAHDKHHGRRDKSKTAPADTPTSNSTDTSGSMTQ